MTNTETSQPPTYLDEVVRLLDSSEQPSSGENPGPVDLQTQVDLKTLINPYGPSAQVINPRETFPGESGGEAQWLERSRPHYVEAVKAGLLEYFSSSWRSDNSSLSRPEDLERPRQRELALSEDQIALGAGSTAIISAVAEVLRKQRVSIPIEAGKKPPSTVPPRILVIPPTYFGLVRELDAQANGPSTDPQQEGQLQSQLQLLTEATLAAEGYQMTERFLAQLFARIEKDRPHVVWLCNPNNPTGHVLSLDVLTDLVYRVPGWLVIDEAYLDPHMADSAVQLVTQFPNVIVIRTFSKAFALQEKDEKIGYVVATPNVAKAVQTLLERKELNRKMWDAGKHEKPYLPSVKALFLARLALKDIAHLRWSAEMLAKTIGHFYEKFAEFEDDFEVVPGSKSGIILLRSRRSINLHAELERRNILTLNASHDLGIEGLGYVRLGLKRIQENNLLFAALRDIRSSMKTSQTLQE